MSSIRWLILFLAFLIGIALGALIPADGPYPPFNLRFVSGIKHSTTGGGQ